MLPGVVGEKITSRRHFMLPALILALVLSVFAGLKIHAGAQMQHEGGQPAEVFDLVNQSRAQAGLPVLEWNDALSYCAQVRAVDISSYFAHQRPDGSAWFSVNPDVQYGENLLYTWNGADAAHVLNLWMSSPAHSALFYDASYRTCAIAKYVEGGSDYWVIEFGY